MNNENLSIEIDGETLDDVYADLLRLEVELDDEMAAFFKMRLSIAQQTDGLWNHLDDTRFQPWKAVTIFAGFDDSLETLMSGYITHVKPFFDADVNQCTLEVCGMDGSVLMDREEMLKDWPNKKDSDIAREIFSAYGFSAEAEDTEIIHDEAISTIIQRETDIQFLKRLALRNGFECYVEDRTAYFRPPLRDETPQPVLSLHFGEETTVSRFFLEVNALSPVNVSMVQVDRTNKEVLEAVVASSEHAALGGTRGTDFLGAGMRPGQIHVGMNATTGRPEMTALCQGLYHEGDWFVTGEGEIIANQYGHVLKPRKTVTLRGLGESHSGVYYVSNVRHVFTGDGYSQLFRVKRNGIGTTGSEDFSSESGLLGGLL